MKPKIRLKDLSNQHNPMCVSKSLVTISKMTDELIKNKNNKTFSAREFKQSCGWLINVATDTIALLTYAHSQITHQKHFSFVSNLHKTHQQLAKIVPTGSEQIFRDDLLKRIQNIKSNKHLFEKESHFIFPIQTYREVSSNPWKPVSERVSKIHLELLQKQSTKQWLQTEGQLSKETQLAVVPLVF